MKRFKCVVTKTYEYEIEIDENVHTEEKLKNWSKYFCEVENLAEFAGELALRKTTHDRGKFIEGFGIPYINGEAPYVYKDYEDSLNPTININVIDESDYPEVDVEEIE